MVPGDDGLCIPCHLIGYDELKTRWEGLKKDVKREIQQRGYADARRWQRLLERIEAHEKGQLT